MWQPGASRLPEPELLCARTGLHEELLGRCKVPSALSAAAGRLALACYVLNVRTVPVLWKGVALPLTARNGMVLAPVETTGKKYPRITLLFVTCRCIPVDQ